METTKLNLDMQITGFMNPESVSHGKYGKICNGRWLEKEKERIEKSSGHECEIVKKDGAQALFYKNYIPQLTRS